MSRHGATAASVLVLVDLDGLRLARLAEVPAVMYAPPAGRVVVGISFNTKRAVPGWGDIDFAARLAAGAACAAMGRGAPSSVVVEPALTLAMPEAADHALFRLFEQAPTEERRGPFSDVWLLTGDLWIRECVERRLGSGWEAGLHPLAGGRWFHRRSPRGWWMRRSPSSPPPSPEPPARDPSSPTLVLDGPETCGVASDLPVQGPAALPDLALDAELRPSILTQVSATAGTTRGCERLAARMAGRAGGLVIGTCEAGDGLEWCRSEPAVVPPTGGRVTVHPVAIGSGAVRLEWGRPPLARTIRSGLVPAVVRAAAANSLPSVQAACRAGVLDDDAALAGLDEGPVRAERCLVRFGCRGRGFRCEVVCSPGRMGPPAWWRIHGSGPGGVPAAARLGAKQDLPVEISPGARRRSIDVEAVPARLGAHVVLCCPVPGPIDVSLGGALAHRTVIDARASGGELRCAVLGLGTRAWKHDVIACVPVQRAGRAGLARRLGLSSSDAALLRRVPLLVPIQDVGELLPWGGP